MKFAIPYEDGKVFQHFGHAPAFKVYVAENGKIVESHVEAVNGSGHGALAGFLGKLGVAALLCGGIGGGARIALAEAGIQVYGGVRGDADEAAEAFAGGVLQYDPNARCSHHDAHHGSGHDCASHDCGSHSCGDHCSH